MADGSDWRVTISLTDPVHAQGAQRSFSAHEVEEDVHARLGGSIAVGAGEAEVFLYAGTEAAARAAEQVAREVLDDQGIHADFALHRWHPVEEEWEIPGVAMPRTEAEVEAEHERLEEAETAESLATGTPQWQARADLGSHRDAVKLADTLRGEGRTVVRRWKFLIVGANNEDDARELAGHIRAEAPPDARVRAEHASGSLPFIPF